MGRPHGVGHARVAATICTFCFPDASPPLRLPHAVVFAKAPGVTHALAQLAQTMLRIGPSVVSFVRLSRELQTQIEATAFDDDVNVETAPQAAAFASLGHAVWTLAQFLTGNLLPNDNDNHNKNEHTSSAKFLFERQLEALFGCSPRPSGDCGWLCVCTCTPSKKCTRNACKLSNHRDIMQATTTATNEMLAESIDQMLHLQRSME